MKNYELMVIFRPNLDNEELDKAIEKLGADLKELGGEILSSEKTGRKKLAYDINNFRDGFFVNFKLSLEGEKVVDFKRNLKLNENVLRTMFLEETKAMQALS